MKKSIIWILMSMFLISIVAADLKTGAMQVTMLSQEPDPAGPGKYVEIRWKVENQLNKIEDLEFEVLPEYPFSLESGDDGIREIGTLYGRQQGDDAVILYYKLRVDENAVEGTNTIRLRYRSKESNVWVNLGEFDVRIQTSDAILSVLSVTSEPEVITPGKKAKVAVKIKNEADSLLRNIKVKWTPLTIVSSLGSATTIIEELPFTPIGSTNEKTIYQLDSKEQTDVEFNIVVSPDAESKDYKVQLTITYEDELGTDYSIDNIMGLIIGNSPDISITLESSGITKAGMKGEVVIKFVNKDVMDIKFATVQLEKNDCYTIISPEIAYLGNIDSDDYETADFTLYVKPGKDCKELPLEFAYKDANNNEYIQNIKIPLMIYSEKEALQMGLTKRSNTAGVLIIIFIVVIGFVIWRFIKKRRSKKK